MIRREVAAELVRIARMLAADARSIVERYPIRNRAWLLNVDGDGFSAEASELGRNWTDPWNRHLPRMQATVDREGDTVRWDGYTTVHSERVSLVVFND